jgi:hypothetical protein
VTLAIGGVGRNNHHRKCCAPAKVGALCNESQSVVTYKHSLPVIIGLLLVPDFDFYFQDALLAGLFRRAC